MGYVAGKQIKVNDKVYERGDPVPDAEKSFGRNIYSALAHGQLIHIPDGPLEPLGLMKRMTGAQIKELASDLKINIEGLSKLEAIDKIWGTRPQRATTSEVPLEKMWRYEHSSPRQYLEYLYVVEPEHEKLRKHGEEFGVPTGDDPFDFIDALLVKAGYEQPSDPNPQHRKGLEQQRKRRERRDEAEAESKREAREARNGSQDEPEEKGDSGAVPQPGADDGE